MPPKKPKEPDPKDKPQLRPIPGEEMSDERRARSAPTQARRRAKQNKKNKK